MLHNPFFYILMHNIARIKSSEASFPRGHMVIICYKQLPSKYSPFDLFISISTDTVAETSPEAFGWDGLETVAVSLSLYKFFKRRPLTYFCWTHYYLSYTCYNMCNVFVDNFSKLWQKFELACCSSNATLFVLSTNANDDSSLKCIACKKPALRTYFFLCIYQFTCDSTL